jgi:hypothetical protein
MAINDELQDDDEDTAYTNYVEEEAEINYDPGSIYLYNEEHSFYRWVAKTNFFPAFTYESDSLMILNTLIDTEYSFYDEKNMPTNNFQIPHYHYLTFINQMILISFIDTFSMMQIKSIFHSEMGNIIKNIRPFGLLFEFNSKNYRNTLIYDNEELATVEVVFLMVLFLLIFHIQKLIPLF